jgi:hypothetical protein
MARIRSGALGTLAIAVLVAAASAWLTLRSNGVECDGLASLTVLAMLSAFVIALCFRQLAAPRTGDGHSAYSWRLFAALLIAATTLSADAHHVVKYRGLCHQLRQQMQRNTPR